MRPAGNHTLAEFDECRSDLLDKEQGLISLMERSIREAGFSLVSSVTHRYEPTGITAISIINESHVVIHTYPEAAHASVDIFTCSADPQKSTHLLELLKEQLQPAHVKTVEFQRGDALELRRPNRISLASQDGIDVSYEISERLVSRNTGFQKIEIARSTHFGKLLVIDDELQISESDMDLYQQSLIAPLKGNREALESVLVLGGGDGSLVRSLLTLEPQQVTVVDIDEEIVALCAEYFPEAAGAAFRDPRVTLKIADAGAFLPRRETYSCVLYDLTMHPEAFTQTPRRAYLSDLFEGVRMSLRNGGIFCLQCCSEFDRPTRELIEELLPQHFEQAAFRSVYIPSFTSRWIFASAAAA